MKVTKHLLASARDLSHKYYINEYKLIDESAEEFRARCWLLGFMEAFKKEGYQIDALDLNTGIVSDIDFES